MFRCKNWLTRLDADKVLSGYSKRPNGHLRPPNARADIQHQAHGISRLHKHSKTKCHWAEGLRYIDSEIVSTLVRTDGGRHIDKNV
jgi:hypothetical protein